MEITTVCLAFVENACQLLFKPFHISFINRIFHSLYFLSNSSFKKLSIVSTSVYQSGDALTLSDFTLKSANLSANIEPFERLCSNRWGFHIKNHQKPVDQHTIDNFLKELFLVKILFLDFVNRCNGFLWSVRQWMGLPDYEKNAVKQGAVSSRAVDSST